MDGPPRRRRRWMLALATTAAALTVALFAGLWTVVQPVWRPGAPLPANRSRASPDRLARDVVTLVERFGPRDHDDPANLDAVATFLATAFEQAGGRVSTQHYGDRDRAAGSFQNVVARFGPNEGPVIVVGAHYDTADGLPGADDNASGTAGLLELARLLGEGPPLETAVELVAFSTEEPPYFRTDMMGSAVHVRRSVARGDEISLMICLEMIGRFEDTPGSQRYPLPGMAMAYPSTGDFIAIVGQWGDPSTVRAAKRAFMSGSPLPVRSINAPPQVPGVDFSDHLNYWAAGVPAVMVTDTAFFRNADYHTADDTPDRLDYDRMGQVVDGVHAMVRYFASGPRSQPPTK